MIIALMSNSPLYRVWVLVVDDVLDTDFIDDTIIDFEAYLKE